MMLLCEPLYSLYDMINMSHCINYAHAVFILFIMTSCINASVNCIPMTRSRATIVFFDRLIM